MNDLRLPATLALIVLGPALASCRSERAERRSDSGRALTSAEAPGDTAATAPSEVVSESGVVRVTGPLVVAFFVAAQADLDADPDAATAADDWQFYLPRIRDTLVARGVAFGSWTGGTLRVREAGRGGAERVLVLADSGVGYVLLRPGVAPRILRGVDTGERVFAESANYFGWAPAPGAR